jgi:hypothetical protein
MTTIDPSYSQEHVNGAHDTVVPDKPTAFGPFGDDLEARVLAVHAELDAAIADAREHLSLLEAVLAKVLGERPGVPPNLSKLDRKQLAASWSRRWPTAALFEEVPRKRVRKPAKASGADSRALAMAMAKRMDAAMKAPKVAKSVRNGKSKPAAGTLGAKVLAEMAHPAFDGKATSITAALGIKPALTQGALNSLLARGFVTSKGNRAARVWSIT